MNCTESLKKSVIIVYQLSTLTILNVSTNLMKQILIGILTMISFEMMAQLPVTTSPSINFNDLEIKFNDVRFFLKQTTERTSTYKDTAELYLDLGETIQGQTFEIVNSELMDIKVEQQYETSLSISKEGPHIDLIDWKHHTSNWVELTPVDTDKYRMISYSIADQEKFPDFTEIELIEYLNSINLKDWAKLIKVPSYSDGSKHWWIGLSSVTIRVSGFSKDNNWVTRYINFEIPMGC